MINKMYESNLSIHMGGNWKVWVEFVETINGAKVVAVRRKNSCAVWKLTKSATQNKLPTGK